MKKKCIISLLFARHHNILNEFLSANQGITIVTPSLMITNTLIKNTQRYNCSVVPLERYLPENYSVESAAQEVYIHATNVLKQVNWEQQFPIESDTENITAQIKIGLTNSVGLIIERLDALKYMQEHFDPLLLLVSEDHTWNSKPSVLWAKENNIPSLLVFHSLYLGGTYSVAKGLCADITTTYGERSNYIFIEQNIDPNRLHLTGNPQWDTYVSLRKDRKNCKVKVSLKYKIDFKKKTILFSTTYSDLRSAHHDKNIYIRTMYIFLKSCKQLFEKGLDFNIIVKDRWETREIAEKTINSILATLNISKKCILTFSDTELLVSSADILVGVTSNYLIEAMLVDTLAVNLLDESNTFMGVGFDADSGVKLAENYNLTSILYTLLTDENEVREQLEVQRSALNQYNSTHDTGAAGTNLAALMDCMINDKPINNLFDK